MPTIILLLLLLTLPAQAREIRPGNETYFSPHPIDLPGESPTAALVRHFDAEDKEILCEVYSFTSRPIAEALIRAHARGVLVRVISDRTNLSGKGSVTPDLEAAGIEVVYDHEHAIMHDKVAIIGRKWLATGSFNWTAAAENKNAENLKIILDPEDARFYAEEWERHRGHSVIR